MRRFALIFLSVLFFCNVAYALPINYNVSGTVYNGENEINLSGHVIISDQLYTNSWEPVPPDYDFLSPPDTGNIFFYKVIHSSISFGPEKFTGPGAMQVWIFTPTDGYPSGYSTGMDWFLGSAVTEPNIYGSSFDFIDQNSQIYDNNDALSYTALPYQIRLNGPNYYYGDSSGYLHFGSDILLTQHTNPVPEPSTIVLMLIGICIVIGIKSRIRNEALSA
jgi:hypothetical protein